MASKKLLRIRQKHSMQKIKSIDFKPRSQSTKVSTPYWLSARYLLRSLDESVIFSCYDEILQSFQDKKDIISTLVKASTSEQIKRIIEILKTAQAKEIEKNRDKLMANYHKNNMNKSYFDYLSEESIFNICEFLHKDDIASFKMTSTFISLIAFEVMRRHKIGVLNMNELIEEKQYKYPLSLDINDKVKINRIKPFIKHRALINAFIKRYNITEKNILILRATFGNKYYLTFIDYNQSLIASNIVDNLITFNQEKTEQKTAFFVLDKSKIITINNSKKLKLMTEIIKPEQMKNYGIVLLQYYNAEEQQIHNLQFLWLEATTTIQRINEYILNDLLSIYTKIYTRSSCSWCSKLLYILSRMKKMGCNHDELLNVYENNNILDLYTLYSSNNDVKHFRVITFEINWGYIGLKDEIKEKQNEQTRFYPFYNNVAEFVTDRKGKYFINMECIDDEKTLRNQIKYYYDDDDDDDKSIELEIKLLVTPTTTFKLIRNQISSLFNYKIPTNNIQIYRFEKYIVCNKANLTVLNGEYPIGLLCSSSTGIYKWQIVTYDTLQDIDYDIHRVSIFEQEIDSEFENIFTFPIEPLIKLNIKFNDFDTNKDDENKNNDRNDIKIRFGVNNFLKHTMDIISHPMYNDEYNWIINKYKDKDKYSFIIMDKKDVNDNDFKCYDENDKYIQYKNAKSFGFCNDQSRDNIYILIIPKIIQYKDENICVIVRFYKITPYTFGESFVAFTSFIGFPFKIFISKKTTMKSLLNDYLGKYYQTKYKFKSCSSKYGDIMINDIIYKKINDKKSTELLISLLTIKQNSDI